MMNKAILEGLNKGINYEDYQNLIDTLLAENKTTGPNQSEAYIGYTKMNAVRMRRLNKTTKVSDDVRNLITNIDSPQTWLVITEAWCGDAAQILPVVNKLADLNSKINVKHVFRDEHEDLMDLFLTGGSRSIPMVVMIDEANNEVVGKWGPRPTKIQKAVIARKYETKPRPYSEFAKDVQKWYAKDKTISIQQEFAKALIDRSN